VKRSRAVQLQRLGDVPVVVDRELPVPAAGEVRIAMRACGICGSDVHIVDGSTPPARLPLVPGHEASGVVDALGVAVTGLRVGDRVTVNPMLSCGACRPCVTGRANLCRSMTILGLGADGAHADHFVVPAGNVIALPDSVGFPLGAIVADAVATPLHAISRAGVRPGDTAAVFGLGGLGLHAAMLLQQVHGVRVVGVDTSDAALERASRFGVADVVDARRGRPADAVKALTGGGVDVALELVGSLEVVEQAVRSLAHGGRCVVVGVGPDRLGLTIRQETLVAKGLSVIGSHGYLRSDVEQILRWLDDGTLTLDGTISHTFDLAEYARGLATLRDRSAGAIRVVLTSEA
jgi:threonine dehydrogenase-like Zn-dependent dehydrogenase